MLISTKQAESVSDQPIATKEASPTKSDLSKHQTDPRQWLRSESEPIPAKSRQPPVQLPSSDDYPDHEIVELLANADVLEDSPMMPPEVASERKAGESTGVDHCSSSDDTFETPPSTPPFRDDSNTAPYRRRKRSYPDSMQAPPPRNVFRKTSGEKSAQENYPQQAAQNRSLEGGLAMSFGSFEKNPSITSSITSASSAGTSTNTSFSVGSLATSFDSSIDGNDTAKLAYWGNPPYLPPLPLLVPESKNDLANRYENEACKVSPGNISEFSDPMDIDSAYPFSNNPLQAKPTDLQSPVEPRTGSTVAGELLAVRLRENPLFGNPFPSLRSYFSLLKLVKFSSSSGPSSVSALPATLRDC